jgi:hypothetical protein
MEKYLPPTETGTNVVPFKRKPPDPPDPRLTKLAKLQAIWADTTQMPMVRLMAQHQAKALEQEMKVEKAQHILKSLMAR